MYHLKRHLAERQLGHLVNCYKGSFQRLDERRVILGNYDLIYCDVSHDLDEIQTNLPHIGRLLDQQHSSLVCNHIVTEELKDWIVKSLTADRYEWTDHILVGHIRNILPLDVGPSPLKMWGPSPLDVGPSPLDVGLEHLFQPTAVDVIDLVMLVELRVDLAFFMFHLDHPFLDGALHIQSMDLHWLGLSDSIHGRSLACSSKAGFHHESNRMT